VEKVLNSSPDTMVMKSRKTDDIGRTCSMNGKRRNAYRILFGKPEGKRPFIKSRCRLENSVKTDFKYGT
jgi:hypothetical protein